VRRTLASLSAVIAVIAVVTSLITAASAAAKPAAVATGSGGAVASESAPATQAGLAVLRRGGTAADAAVAVASTLGVSDPLVAGIGGGGYLVYYDAKTHSVSTIDGRENAPAAATPALFIDPVTHKPLAFPTAVTSGLSVGVPGTLMTWQTAVKRWGRFSLADDLRPAEHVAQAGYVLSPGVREEIRENAFRFRDFTSTRGLFLPGGRIPKVGTRMRNPDLAATYRQIARGGVGAFYGGQIGSAIVDAVHRLPVAPGITLTQRPGSMTRADLSRYQAIVRAPTHVTYRGLDVFSMAPSSSGGTTVGEALNILSRFPLSQESRVQALHQYLEASRLAFADRNRYIGDPGYVKVPESTLLSPSFARRRACLITPSHALKSPVAPGSLTGSASCTPSQPVDVKAPTDGAATNHFVIADRQGDVVSYTNTIEELGGNGVVVPGRGFLLNNELTDFDFAPLSKHVPDPNLPASGKRPRSSMSPTIVLRDGRPFLALGAAGGATIITTVLQTLVDRVDLHESLPAAIAAPRAAQENEAATLAEPAFIHSATGAGLEKLGEKFETDTTSPLDPKIRTAPTIGAASGLEVLGHGRFVVSAEPTRAGGGAAGVLSP
jgi:gamma-glutamyltranspeptidase/glutathione hydrolase